MAIRKIKSFDDSRRGLGYLSKGTWSFSWV